MTNFDEQHTNSAAFSLNDFVPYQIRRTQVAVTDSLSAVYDQEFGLTRSEWRVIAIIAREGKITSRDIVEAATVDKVAVSRAVARLEKKKLVERRPNHDDGRSALLTLSSTGTSLFDKISTKILKVEQALLMGLDNNEKQTLMILLKKIEVNAADST